VALARRFAGQLALPRGRAGKWLGTAMDMANASVTRRAVELLGPQPGESVLDAGCGTGSALAEVRRRTPACDLIGIDRSETMIDAARKRLGENASLRTGAVEELAPDISGLDGALLLNVLYFCGADAAMVRAVHRRLKPGGRLVAYVTDRATMERWAFARSGLHRLFDRHELPALLVAGGFARAQITVHEERVAHFARGLFAVAYR
jgi:ubiquinone/menaquinone biosynthesis C-methylase UbiE